MSVRFQVLSLLFYKCHLVNEWYSSMDAGDVVACLAVDLRVRLMFYPIKC